MEDQQDVAGFDGGGGSSLIMEWYAVAGLTDDYDGVCRVDRAPSGKG